MDETMMTNLELSLAQKLARAMGYPLDELAHPYREGKPWAGDGGQYMELHDFNPVKDPADAMRVQIFFNLALETQHDVICVREGQGPLLMIYTIDDLTPEGRLAAACLAISNAACIMLSRIENKKIASATV